MTYQCERYIEPGEMVCTGAHCNQFQNTSQFKRFCLCKTSSGQTIPDCQVKGPATPIPFKICYNEDTKEQVLSTPEACRDRGKPWLYTDCYCCCSCFAYDTKIAVSASTVRFIQSFDPGNPVYAASIERNDDGLTVHWEERPVVMSNGTGGGTQEMVLVHYGDDGEIIVTADHLFLMPEGKLLRADRLRAGDSLVADDAIPVLVASAKLGIYTGGIHHISTAFEPGEIPMDGHLLSANGVITADYILQISQGTDEVRRYLVDDLEKRPVIGSEAYEKANGSLFASSDGTERAIRSWFFEAHQELTSPRGVPEWAPRFLTEKQAEAVRDNAPAVPVIYERNLANFRYIQELFRGFFPGIRLYVEWADETPNLYAFRQFGSQTVYISGRLLRTECINRDGLALILAHGVARLLALSIVDRRGYDCTGASDFDAISYVLGTAFAFEPSLPFRGYEQVKALFAFAGDQEKHGDSECKEPSLTCRLTAFENGLAGFDLPPCAGGPTPAALKLERATAEVVEGTPSVVARFSLPLNVESAQNITHYVITPTSVVNTAVVGADAPDTAILTVTLGEQPDGDYVLQVRDIVAADESTLDPNATRATFHVVPDGKRRASGGKK